VITLPERDDRDLALLLDLPDGSAERANAEARLNDDPVFAGRFAELQVVASKLEGLGEALQNEIPPVNLWSDVEDAVCHLNWEGRDGAERPFHNLEQVLESAGQAIDEAMPPVDLVDPVTEAARAARQSDGALDLSFGPLAQSLNALGDSWTEATPEVDLRDSVMGRLAEKKAAVSPSNVVPMRARPVGGASVASPSSGTWMPYVGWAVAAGLCVTAAWMVYQGQTFNDPATNQRTQLPGAEENSGRTVDENSLPMERVVPHDTLAMNEGAGEEGPDVAPHTPDPNQPLTLQEAINARRRSLVNNVAAFEQLASLSADEANRLLQDLDLSDEALLGAAQFLSQEDAAAVLRAAVANDPENESLKYALARSLAGIPDGAGERQAQLEGLLALNKDNALPHYLLAADHMARGDVAAGMNALSEGAAGAEADPYTLARMREREAVLRASGLDADVARYLAVSTAGQAEAADIAALRNELLDYGALYEQQGDLETAQQIYNAVNQLGVQVTDGADMALLQQTGLETQQDAIYALQGIADILQQPENVALLGETLNILAGSIAEVTNYVMAAQDVVNNPQATSTDWQSLIQHILAQGDTDISNLVTP